MTELPAGGPAPFSGFGLGLRPDHYAEVLRRDAVADFFEVISENFMVDGGRPLNLLDRVRERYPLALHGVSMSLGGKSLDPDYLRRLKALSDRVRPLWLSDHLCWTGSGGINSHDLLPLPLTQEALERVAANIHHAQEVLEQPLLIENPSSYITYPEDSLTEWQFLTQLCARTGCGLLLDVNNIYVSAHNHGFDARAYLDGIPFDRVRQIHLAGHTVGDGLLIDTHDQPVPEGVWSLYAETVKRCDTVAVMIERDDDIPPLDDLLAELAVARRLAVPELA
ncbi:xylose isomerase-like TIM barrel family protein [Asticcacaulis biprosthecium C19]|uniref:UPF0276 protein ABI_22150 n=1 Tax=Asticcacaulis biprosthecium C19 TaxID=715226 RepID=F4QN96_9CAUL|nr:DUF692 domain-containing protein [Asticcacaulis biprosthecium]EGF90804.1 xylose isomerase-like TIM barrel family protein [Asticcacaulis biprosthecium C19]